MAQGSPFGLSPSQDYTDTSIEISRDGKLVEMDVQQVNTSSLGMIFSLKPETIWLQLCTGVKLFLPDEDGKFPGILNDVSVRCYGLKVNGVPNKGIFDTMNVASPTVSTQSRDMPPVFRSVISRQHTSKSKLKIVRANMTYAGNGRPQFQNIDVLYIDIDEASANVVALQKSIQEELGENYILVTNDGLTIKDNPATRGL